MRYLFSIASNTIDSFDPFNIFELNRRSAKPALFPHLRVLRRLARLLPSGGVRCFVSIVRRVMWKITTRGFTLEEVLIMAAMNLLASADTAKYEKRALHTSSRRYQKGDPAWN